MGNNYLSVDESSFGSVGKWVMFNPCPASIWLLGAGANCNKHNGHDGPHEVKIEWTVK